MTENSAMLDNNDVTEIEEGVIEGTDPAEPTSSKEKTRLSMVSQKYDIDGDGVLDPAELASKLSFRCVTSLCHDTHRHCSHM